MTANFDPQLLEILQSRTPLLWLNPARGGRLPGSAPSLALIDEAESRLARCAPLLAALFPELAAAGGHIESRLMDAKPLHLALGAGEASGNWYLKRDDELPVAGSIKARGGFHEVLAISESIALEHGLLQDASTDRRVLATPQARALFGQYAVTVGSTGNLGMSIGVMAAALGFDAVVHMSADAKEWKKDRLRQRGVRVVEHAGDYAEAVAAGRAQALAAPRNHFVDDEQSELLFFGYAAAARGLAAQLTEAGRVVDADHPLFVYIPCGVGGAPGGISHGLKALFGPHVHCFFAEPVASPCVLVQLASGSDTPVSVYDLGLDNRTEADGLAVGQASELVTALMGPQLGGVFTVSDDELYLNLLALKDILGVEVEPSAAAGVSGPRWLLGSAAGRSYTQGIEMSQATHVIWTTGGSLVPSDALRGFQEHARRLVPSRAPSQSVTR
jgi:D-serine dehydratase